MLARSTLWSQACGSVCVASYNIPASTVLRSGCARRKAATRSGAAFRSPSNRFTAWNQRPEPGQRSPRGGGDVVQVGRQPLLREVVLVASKFFVRPVSCECDCHVLAGELADCQSREHRVVGHRLVEVTHQVG